MILGLSLGCNKIISQNSVGKTESNILLKNDHIYPLCILLYAKLNTLPLKKQKIHQCASIAC